MHSLSLQFYGGAAGIRDEGMLESAIARPYQTFDGVELHPTAIEKAAAITESIIVNHPYVDGNKRTGFLAMFAMLELHGIQLTATEADAYDTIVQVSTGQIHFEDLVDWLNQNVVRIG
ncbi:MAG: type II toxin-antitoxin system death-on-curing family toxin [Chitinophagaceae bacterium]|nr:type II toxin-antitoxin system death-on-curing family toxin [Chitinophagaceae bacterium]